MGIRWDASKNARLKESRGKSFEEVLQARFIGIERHPARPHQNLLLFELDRYIWLVPYVEDGDGVFLKTLFPSRAFTKRWLRGDFE